MRYVTALAGFLLIAAPAAAQMYPGQDVTVNPGAGGMQVLLYPGGQFGRVVPTLRQPGGSDVPVHLHMPTHHHYLERPLPEVAQVHRAAPLMIARQATTHHVAAAPAKAPVAAPPETSLPPLSDFGEFAVSRPTAPTPTKPEPAPQRVVQHTAPIPQRTASIEPPPVQHTAPIEMRHVTPVETPQSVTHVQPPVQHTAPVLVQHAPAIRTQPQRVASIEPPPVQTPAPARLSTLATIPEVPSGTKRGVILFAANADDPTVAAMQTAKSMAGELSTALGNGTSRVQLLAYGGPRGDKSSDTRRLSLKRALVVRQVLIDQGVPAERIDVRAMGGADDSGPLDRVDVFLKS